MKLKYYLRGLGIGVFVTAVIVSFVTKPEKMTDAQIKLRAAELGMVEESVLADLEKNTEIVNNSEETVLEKEGTAEETVVEETAEETVTETASNDDLKEVAETEESTIEEAAHDTSVEMVKVDDELVSKQQSAKEDLNQSEQGKDSSDKNLIEEAEENYIIITINRGNGSDTVSRKLMEAGLINSAAEYDKFLISNGYDRRLSVGDHEIPVGASEEEMAKILCGMK